MRPPGLVDFPLWSKSRWSNVDVVGESHHEDEIRRLLPRNLGSARHEVELRASLIPEPTNRYDRNAVKVVAGGQHVGYLAKEIAGNYQPILVALQQQGFFATTDCTVSASEYDDWQGTDRRGRDIYKKVLSAGVRIVLDEPWLCVPVNLPPTVPHVMLPQGSALQARKEEEHQDAIRPWLRPQGEAWAYATLHVVTDTSTRTPRQLIEIRIDGLRVGELTPAMSAEFAPVVGQLEEAGQATAARIIVKGNQIKADVVLYATKANQLDAEWIATNLTGGARQLSGAPAPAPATSPVQEPPAVQRAHRPVPPKPTTIRFNPPPAWPAPPPGWEPPPGWMPLPDWPAAPEQWSFWVVGD